MKNRTRLTWRITLLTIVIGCSFIGGDCIKHVVDPTVQSTVSQLEGAINRIAEHPDRWLAELKELESNLKTDSQQILADVDHITQRAIAATGEQVRCSIDFVGRRVKLELEKLVAALQKRPVPTSPPYVCTVSPSQIELGRLPATVTFSGYDFDSPLRVVAISKSGGEKDLSGHLSRASDYTVVLNLSGNRAGLRCSDDRLILKSNSATVLNQRENTSEVPIVWPTCAPAPPPPQRLPRRLHQPAIPMQNCNGGLFGCREDRSYGGPCPPGYEYLDCTTTKTAGAGQCYKVDRAQAANDCSCVVHFGAPAANGVECNISIWEQGVQQPAPPPPPCLCRDFDLQ